MKNKTIFFSEICKLKDKKTFIYTEKVLCLFYSWCNWFPRNCGLKVQFRVPENGRGLLGARVCSHLQLLSQTCVCVFRVCVWARACCKWTGIVFMVCLSTCFLNPAVHISNVFFIIILLSSNVPFIKVGGQSFAVSGRVLHGQRRRFCRIFCVGWDHHWRCGRLVSRAGGWRGFGSLRLVYLEKTPTIENC